MGTVYIMICFFDILFFVLNDIIMGKEWNNVESYPFSLVFTHICSTLVFSLFGYLSRLLTVYLFQSQNSFEKGFAIISIDMFASFSLYFSILIM